MTIERFTSYAALRAAPVFEGFRAFLDLDPRAHFFQSPEYFEFIEPVVGYRPMLFIAKDEQGRVRGSLLGIYQREGSGPKSWLSRRLIINGGPIGEAEAADALIGALVKDARGNAIYVEFRNTFDMAHLNEVFARHEFAFQPHLNFLLEMDGVENAMKKLNSNRRRQVRLGQEAGATFGEAVSEQELREFYALLVTLYREKVKKPLPDFALFKRLHDSPSGEVFVVRYQGRVVGGSAGPFYKNGETYQWYACGDHSYKGVYANVLATWAHIEQAARKGQKVFDFMGGGKPGQGYGVHQFKAEFGGKEVAPGRYERILNAPLYKFGKWGLKTYSKLVGGKEAKS